MSFYRDVTGRNPPDGRPAAEITEAAKQFGGILMQRLAMGVFGTKAVEFSRAVTEGMTLTGFPRDRVRVELRRFLEGSVQTRDVGIPVYLNLVATGRDDGARAIELAGRYDLDTVEVARAILVGLDADRTETLLHIAAMTGADAFALVCNAVSIEVGQGTA